LPSITPAPVREHLAEGCATLDPGQGHEGEAARHQFEPEKNDADEADGKDDGADDRLAGRDGAGDGERGGDAENGA
jgi:hypothetical protein